MKILIDFTVYKKLTYYIKYAEGEISGLAKVQRDPEDRSIFKITDIVLLKQKCTGVNTQLQADSIAEFYEELMKKGQDTGEWRCWWHSHALMDTFWSGTDTATIEELNPETTKDNYIISIVSNKKEEVLARIDCFDPIRATIDKLDVEVPYIDDELELQCMNEVEEKLIKDSVLAEYHAWTPEEIAKENEQWLINDYKEECKLNKYDPRDLTDNPNPPDRLIDGTGVYIMGKDMLYHKKLRNITKQESKAIDRAMDKEFDTLEGIDAAIKGKTRTPESCKEIMSNIPDDELEAFTIKDFRSYNV